MHSIGCGTVWDTVLIPLTLLLFTLTLSFSLPPCSPKAQGATKPGVIRRHLTTQPGRVYSLRQAKADIDSVYSTGLFEDVNIVPQEAEDSTETQPKVRL